MNKEQIEEMARDICECYKNDGICYQDDMPCDLKCEHMTQAQFLYDKGYRKVIMCKDCKYCDFGYPEKEIGKEPIGKYYCLPQKRTVLSTDFCSCAKMKGAE